MKRRKCMQVMAFLFAVVLMFVQIMSVNTYGFAKTGKRSLNVKNMVLTAGKSKQLKVSGLKAGKVKWSTSKKSVASVDKKGKVTARKAGKAVITAKFSGGKLKCNVTVKAKKKTTKKPAATAVPTVTPTSTSDNTGKVLVAYFSWSGTSERIAKNIIEQTGADSFRIEREIPYSSDYQTTAYGDAKTEADTNARPAIKDPLQSVAQNDKIIVCYPIWWHTAPMTVGTFLESYDLIGKKIYPVSQSASMDKSQYDESVTFIKGCAKGATVDDGIFSKNTTEIQTYISRIINE